MLAEDWLRGETRGVSDRLASLSLFFEKYIFRKALPLDPGEFLSRQTSLPDFFKTACPNSIKGSKNNNLVHAFLEFVLTRDFSSEDERGRRVVGSQYHNPIVLRSARAFGKLDESVHSPLPYGYIDDLRQMLAAGPNFRDWHWAQSALGTESGKGGMTAPDWYEVTKNTIDNNDPDCIWRIRSRTQQAGGPTLEMWSPVRWVALLVKLIVPIRTFQVCMLDSGEADTWCYDSTFTGYWRLNTGPLAKGSERKPVQQGVFRRPTYSSDCRTASPFLYINTNKTADSLRSGVDKGFLMPWISTGPLHQNIFYWLEKLRNWQSKYNPIRRRTSWTELDARHMSAKSTVQLAGYPDACFCFRLPETGTHEHHLPVPTPIVHNIWRRLLASLQERIAARGESLPDGGRIRLVSNDKTLYPLHSLRVSLITALALDGQVPFPLLQKLIGHSRLLMTLYYLKPGATRSQDILNGAARLMDEKKEQSILNFLLDTDYDALLKQAITNGSNNLAATIAVHPANRNPVGWMPMHHGLCLVGGNTSEIEGNGRVGGCYNGGPQLVTGTSTVASKHAPVPGGSRNCVRCRWFVTEAHHLPALAAHFNNLAYHFDEARGGCIEQEHHLQELKRQKAAQESAGQPFTENAELRQTERIWEAAMKRFSDLAEDLVACWRLIERCKAALEAPGDGTQLVAGGPATDVQLRFEESDSALLQISGVCRDVEIYPDLSPGKAVLRRSQILDAMFHNEGLAPGFMFLSEDQQLRLGNAFLRQLGRQVNPENPVIGERNAIALIDGGKRLSQYFGIKLEDLLPPSARSFFRKRDSLVPLEIDT
jgi:hypothetical protein